LGCSCARGLIAVFSGFTSDLGLPRG
jgi:hypothetical protein